VGISHGSEREDFWADAQTCQTLGTDTTKEVALRPLSDGAYVGWDLPVIELKTEHPRSNSFLGVAIIPRISM